MNTINWGIIGCGDVAEVKSGPAFQKIKNSKLIAVMRRNAVKAEDFATRHNVPFWYNSVDELLQNPEINAIYIATPPSTHIEMVKKCVNAKKFIYLEKPITLNLSEAQELNKLITKNDKLVVAHYRRKLPVFLKVKELIEANRIGKIMFADIQIHQSKQNNIIAKTEDNWRLQPQISGGGYFHDIAPHQLDLMYSFFGEIKHEKGFSTSTLNNNVDDIVNGIIEFKNGIQFRGIWNFNTSEKEVKDECKIYGENGSITFSFYGEEVILSTNTKEEVFHFKNPMHVQQPMIESTVNYFLGKEKNPCPIENGVIIMQIMDSFTK
ncbi:Gfo/Idh/MocA family oxidoreductase [Polaribacter sp. Z014]|uniref:Gfo/Idh/MocA family protein n=1 Tax=unclassified Polaribacter TaxID=196858 RepID=UPI00193B3A4D|nr:MULTISPECIES: Gfo/Idh/MocA family oxidoreductase [unclassified Polaribacter]MCL7764869.1 Gfo/Idh/MocA family oxidoreductase [Polaribacter sp. Z014]QVY65020.1 Gfo/Idh/MocA family oxidoreductase [Polaribacter sp. Q13]